MARSRGSVAKPQGKPERDPYRQLAAGILARALDDLAGRSPRPSPKDAIEARTFLQTGAGGLFDLFDVDPGVVGELLGEG